MAFDKSRILAPKEAQPRLVKFSDGTEETLHFKVPSAADVRRWHEAERGNDEDSKLYGMQRLIAASLYDPATKKMVLTGDDVAYLTYSGCNDLIPHVLEVAGVTTGKKDLPAVTENGSATS